MKVKKQEIFEWLDSNKMEMAKFLSDMVKIPSINEGTADTGDEREIAGFISKFYEGMELDVEIMSFDSEGKRPNVIGTYAGTGGGRSILFNAHTDVVHLSMSGCQLVDS